MALGRAILAIPFVTERSDSRIPPDEVCVLAPLLELRAREIPEELFAHFEDGTRWSYAQTLDVVRRTALGLQKLGVKPGDYVNVWIPSGPDAVRVWFAINYLGAIYVPINLAYLGAVLQHVLTNVQARLIIVHADLCHRLAQVDCGGLTAALVVGGRPPEMAGLQMYGADALEAGEGDLPVPEKVHPWDTQMVIHTSGTTGPSKGVLVSYFHIFSCMKASSWYLGGQDRVLINLPLFHIAGAGAVLGTLFRGASFAMVGSFKTDEFWSIVRALEVTSVTLLGAMTAFLLRQPRSASDLEHPLRSALIAPVTLEANEFAGRFGLNVYTAYGMTEISVPLRAGPNPAEPGTCGTPRPGVEVRVVDGNDCEVACGQVGELIVRTDAPWAMTRGYLRNDGATAAAWRNGWFHTGDAFRQDARGNFYFVDRIIDVIRRRGENISAFDVECELCAHPLIEEAAAVAVSSEFGEDEVLVVISLHTGQSLDPVDLIRYLQPRMPYFMVPRYVRFLAQLPKTPTHKVMKHILRAEGVTADTFDRKAAGLVVKSTKLGLEEKR